MAREIVINYEHGGYGLSTQAVLRYAELKGITLYIDDEFYVGNDNGICFWTVPKEERMKIPESIYYDNKAWAAFYKDSESKMLEPNEIARDDTCLVQVVKELGEKANGRFAALKVVSIPENVDWLIVQYDGKEHIAEQHRKWS